MSDQAAARREARRRKILEQSESRLNRITGKSGTKPSIIIAEPDGTEELVNGLMDTTESLKNCHVNQEKENISHTQILRTQPIDTVPQDYPEQVEDFSHPEEISNFDDAESLPRLIPLYQPGPSLYISTAILFRIFLEFNLAGICPNNVIVAFLMIKCGSLVLYGAQPSETSPLLQALFILSGVSSQKIRLFSLCFGILLSIVEHFSMFTFAFVLSDALASTMRSMIQ